MSLGELIFMIVLALAWYVNHGTRKFINRWSWENNYEIVDKRFYPIYIMIWPWGLTGLHPASYKVSVKDKNGIERVFKIAGGGPFWISREYEVEEVKK